MVTAFPGSPQRGTHERKALFIFLGITLAEVCWFFSFWGAEPWRVVRWFGLDRLQGVSLTAWACAAGVAFAYSYYARRLPSVRLTMFRWDVLKCAAILLAIAAALCEEGVFRKTIMSVLQNHGAGAVIQVSVSGLCFGLAHAVWGLLKGSLRAAMAATIATSVMGTALAVIYLLAGRNVWPCVVSHFLITATIEPGLVLSALRGEMGGITSRGA
jgi:hypothetical protein